MATDCQRAAQSGGGEHQNLGAVNSFEGKIKGGGQLKTANLIRVVSCKICFSSIYFVKYMLFIVWKALRNDLDHFCR